MTTTWTPPTNKLKTLITILLDRSGSMHGSETDVVGGVNKFLEEQKALDAPATISMWRFDGDSVEQFRTPLPLASCKPLEKAEFQPRGSTPLLDAIGKAMQDMDTQWSREQPDRAIMIIVTDGQENASREFKLAKIKEMIQARQKSDKWAFIYLGADVSAFAEATSLGINLSNTAGYTKTAAGFNAGYAAASTATMGMRSTGHTVASNLGKVQLGEDEDAARKPSGS